MTQPGNTGETRPAAISSEPARGIDAQSGVTHRATRSKLINEIERSKAGEIYCLIMAAAGALANINPHDVLRRYAAGEYITEIAKELGVHHTSLYRDLIRDCPEDWTAHQAARSLAAYEQAMQDLDTLQATQGPVACTLAQARVKARQWELERLLKRLYGPAMAITGADGGPVQVQVVRFGRTIDAEPVAETPNAATHTPVLANPDTSNGA